VDRDPPVGPESSVGGSRDIFFNHIDSKKCMFFKLFHPVNVKPCVGRDRFSGENSGSWS